ncbi:hypothetical protein P7C73_g6265, partial [Tremellales sp. Uapishka_1]
MLGKLGWRAPPGGGALSSRVWPFSKGVDKASYDRVPSSTPEVLDAAKFEPQSPAMLETSGWRAPSSRSDSFSDDLEAEPYTKGRRPVLRSLGVVVALICFLSTTYFTTLFFLPYSPTTLVPPGEPYTFHLNTTIVPIHSDSTHILVAPKPLPAPVRLLQPIRNRLAKPLLTSYFDTGSFPLFSFSFATPPPLPKFDLVYLFVNATSAHFQRAIGDRAAGEGIKLRGGSKHWRDNGELRGAIRSGAISLKDRIQNIHVVSGDYGVDPATERISEGDTVVNGTAAKGWRVGQIPRWLDWKAQATSRIKWHFHSEIWRQPQDDDGRLSPSIWDDEEEWRGECMPNFDSFEIESRIGWVEGLEENFVLSNDDMFVLVSWIAELFKTSSLTSSQAELATTDFFHPVLGNVVRLQPGPNLLVRPLVTPDLHSTSGEWGGLQHASKLISQRFGPLSRMYIHHLPKSLTKTLVHETSIMFSKELTVAATRGFRASKRGLADVEMAWLVTHLGIERWREALLWSFVVAKVGGASGVWGEEAREEMRAVLGMVGDSQHTAVVVTRGRRTTLSDMEGMSQNAGWEAPKHTKYVFSSMDGHLPANPERPAETCDFVLSQCLPVGFFNTTTPHPADSIFKRLAFEQPNCGSCLIDALVAASGSKGLKAFLPDKKHAFHPVPPSTKPLDTGDEPRWEREEPMLPLVDDWHHADFTITNVVKAKQDLWYGEQPSKLAPEAEETVNLHDWCVKLLSRYTYVFSTTPYSFGMAHSAKQLATILNNIEKSTDVALVCINDDQPDSSNGDVGDKFADWMQGRWGDESEWVDWEREDVEWRR